MAECFGMGETVGVNESKERLLLAEWEYWKQYWRYSNGISSIVLHWSVPRRQAPVDHWTKGTNLPDDEMSYIYVLELKINILIYTEVLRQKTIITNGWVGSFEFMSWYKHPVGRKECKWTVVTKSLKKPSPVLHLQKSNHVSANVWMFRTKIRLEKSLNLWSSRVVRQPERTRDEKEVYTLYYITVNGAKINARRCSSGVILCQSL